MIKGVSNLSNSSTSGLSTCVFLNYPTYVRDAAGSVAQVTASNLLPNEQKVFDEYKVVSLRVTYISWVTEQARVSTAVALTAPTDPKVYMLSDFDDSALLTGEAKALNAQSATVFNCYRPTNKPPSMLMKQPDKDQADRWLNLGAIIPNPTTAPDPYSTGKLACIKIWKNAFLLASTIEATLYYEWEVRFRGTYTLA